MADDLKEKFVTTQQTSKKFKVSQIFAVVLICIGVVSCVGREPGASGFFLVTGFALFLYARVGAWWRNG